MSELNALFTELQGLPAQMAEMRERITYLEDRLAIAERSPLTVAQAAQALGVTEKTVRRQIAAGKIQHRRTGSRVSVYLAPVIT